MVWLTGGRHIRGEKWPARRPVVLDMYIIDKMRTRGVHCRRSSSKHDTCSADVIHLDEDTLEGSESHLRAARTPANFWK